MRTDHVTTSGALTAGRRRGVHLITGAAIGGALWAAAAPWWASAAILAGLWLVAVGSRRMTPSDLLTRCSA